MKSTTDTRDALKLKIDKTDLVPLLLWLTIVFLTWLFMNGVEHFLSLTPEALGKYFELRWIVIAHITAGGGALVMGLIQFWPKLRQFSWKTHRIIGMLYLLAVAVSGLCAVILSTTTAYTVNWPYAFSLQIWVGVWISSTAIAYYTALKKNFMLHRQWMTRSYIVTLAFLVSGLLLKTTFVQQMGSFADISPSFFWFGWAVPLYMYEIFLASRAKISTSRSTR